MSYFNPVTVFSCTIDDAATVSEIVNLGGLRAFGVNIPATVAGANITFEGSDDGVTFKQIYKNDNTALSLAITAAKFVGFGDLIPYFAPWQYVRVTTDSAASGADEEFEIVARDL